METLYRYKILQTTLYIGGVQDLMSLMAVGSLKELIVQFLNCQVILGSTQICILIIIIQNSRTNSTQIHVHTNSCRLMRLTAAVDTSAGTSHDLNELNVQLAGLDLVEQCLGIGSSAGNSNIDGHIANLIGCGLDAFNATNFNEVQFLKLLAFNNLCQYDSLDNAKKYENKMDLIVHTTSVGMYPDTESNPIEGFEFSGKEIVYDIIYKPMHTKLLREAEKKGCEVHFGREMLIEQGKLQFEAFTGYHYPKDLNPEI